MHGQQNIKFVFLYFAIFGTVHRKVWITEILSKITEIVSKITEIVSKITEIVSKITEIVSKILGQISW